MAITQLPFNNNYNAWKNHPLYEVILYTHNNGATDGKTLTIRNLLNDSTFDLLPIIRKDTFGADRTVAFKIRSVLNVYNNELWQTEESLYNLANGNFKRALFKFSSTLGINTAFRFVSGNPPVTVSNISTAFQISGVEGNIIINISSVMSIDAFNNANSIIIGS